MLMQPAAAVDALPEFSGEWVNCEPFEAADLQGKMLVLIFFDEGAPQYKTLWAELAKIKQTHELTDRVLFIAINSGSPKAQMIAYCRAYGVTWKLLADEARTFEKQFGIRIDKENFQQVYFVEPGGRVQNLDTTQLAKSVKDAVDRNKGSVKWRLDPKDVPPAANAMWISYEFGAWRPLMGAVSTNLRSREPKLRECAVTIDTAVKEIIKAKTEKAKAIHETGDKWRAFKAYRAVVQAFPERPEAGTAYREAAKLGNEGSVDFQVQARLALDQTEAAVREIVTQPGAKAWYEAVVKNYPKTEAAETAQALIDDAFLSAGLPIPARGPGNATNAAATSLPAGASNGPGAPGAQGDPKNGGK